jgi:hypothetical protein
MEACMFYLNSAAIVAAAGFGFVNAALADGTGVEAVNKALAEAKSSGKPLLVIGGAPER